MGDTATVGQAQAGELDVESIVARLRAGLLAGGPGGEALTRLAQADETARRVAWHLYLAEEAIATHTVGGFARGGILGAPRRLLHQLVRYYVESAMRRRSAVDRNLAAALVLLAEQAAADRAELARLHVEMAELRRSGPTGRV